MEDSGQCRRGYFVEGLGAAQFALPGAVDRMRAMASDVLPAETAAAADPAATTPESLAAWSTPGQSAEPDWNIRPARPAPPARTAGPRASGQPGDPRSRCSCWPRPTRPTPTAPRCPGPSARPRPRGGHRPGRKAGALVVLARGELVLYVERGGKTLLSWTSDPEILEPGRPRAGRGRPGRRPRPPHRGARRRRRRLRLAAGPGPGDRRLPPDPARPAPSFLGSLTAPGTLAELPEGGPPATAG